MDKYDLYYVQINIFCLLLLLIMYANVKGSNGIASSRKRLFRSITIVASIMCGSDVLAWLGTDASFPGAFYIAHIFNMIYYATVTTSAFLWLCFVYEYVHPEGYNKKFTNIAAIPLYIMLLVILSNPFTGLQFTIDPVTNSYTRANGVVLHWIISYGYMLVAFIIAFKAYRSANSLSLKRVYRPLMLFFLWPILAAIIQMLFVGITTTQCGITLSIVTISLSSLQQEISTDELTGLNNRNALRKRATDDISNSSVFLSVLLCDIDKFKTINDTMGHATGDIALKTVSRSLKDAAAENLPHSFLCRYGGDEFVVVVREERDVKFDSFITSVEEDLKAPEKIVNGLVRLQLSYGTSEGVCHTYEEFEELLKKADHKMYENKKAKHLTR